MKSPTAPAATVAERTFQINQLGAGFFALGNWYWAQVTPTAEPNTAHGPYPFRRAACVAAKLALGLDAEEVYP